MCFSEVLFTYMLQGAKVASKYQIYNSIQLYNNKVALPYCDGNIQQVCSIITTNKVLVNGTLKV